MPRWLILVLLAAACRSHQARRTSGDPLVRIPRSPRESAGQAPGKAPVVREASVIVFWLAASDTIPVSDAGDALDDFRYYTGKASAFFEQWAIPLVGTNCDTVVVELPDGSRRRIMLSGLDYPFGYVLIEPGTAEQILTGISTDEELMDAATDYFDLGEGDSLGVVAALGPRP